MPNISELSVGFVGLGNMGGPMALNIVNAGFNLSVFDRRDSALDEVLAHGASRSESIANLASSVDVLCTCVMHDHQVRDIFFGDSGILAHGKPGLVAVIHSTVPPSTVQEIAEAAISRDVQIIDAPVSGAQMASEAGTLTLMVGGPDSAVQIARPVFEAVAENVFEVGDAGMGQVAKLGNNIMAVVNQLVAMEAAQFVEAFGMDKERLFEIAAVSSGASWAVANYAHFDRLGIEEDDVTQSKLPARIFAIGKDLRYALSIAQERRAFLPISGLCSQLLPAMFAARWNTTVRPRHVVETGSRSGG